MKPNKMLLVTFPVDLGNRTIESNLHEIFSEEMDFYRFASDHAVNIDKGRITVSKSLGYRFKSALGLRYTVNKYKRNNQVVVFNGLSPALFGFSLFKNKKTVIVFDWTRTLYPSVLGLHYKKDWVFHFHKFVLGRSSRLLCWTDAVIDNLVNIYGINPSVIRKVPAPFMVSRLDIPPRPTPALPRVLFVGGDLKRKGGDIILQHWKDKLKDKCVLTMMTNDRSAKIDGINFLPGVRYGSPEHRKAFETHDILILPTRIDAYPQVLGEAAAAGMAVITTRFALGAAEVVIHGQSGIVNATPDDCIASLLYLLKNTSMIDEFKEQGYQLMHQNFSKDAIRSSYLDAINN